MAVSWKGSISFGLIYIPIKLELAAQENNITFNQLHRKCKQRIKYKKVCPDCDMDVKDEDIVKGYQYEKDKYVLFEDSDFEALKTERDKSIVIEQFTDLSEIDPIYYEKSYYVIPTGAEKAFELLKRAMQEENKVGIAKAVLGSKENLIALRINGKEMILSTLFFNDEIRMSSSKELNIKSEPKELNMAKAIITNMTEPFKPEQYKDEYKEKLKSAIELKIKGKKIVKPKEEKLNTAIDLMDALAESLKASKGDQSSKATH